MSVTSIVLLTASTVCIVAVAPEVAPVTLSPASADWVNSPPMLDKYSFVTESSILPIKALNPVRETSILSLSANGPLCISTTSTLVAPVATTLAVALETKPITVSPIDGNIPPIVFKLNLVIGYKSTSMFL